MTREFSSRKIATALLFTIIASQVEATPDPDPDTDPPCKITSETFISCINKGAVKSGLRASSSPLYSCSGAMNFQLDGEIKDEGGLKLVEREYDRCSPGRETVSDGPMTFTYSWTIRLGASNVVARGGGRTASYSGSATGAYVCTFTVAGARSCLQHQQTHSAGCYVFRPEIEGTNGVLVGQQTGLRFSSPGAATWSSSDSSVATVQGGLVKGLKSGTVCISARDNNGCSASKYIRVVDMSILPDFNRDRVINDTDRAALKNGETLRMWINDDADSGDIAVGDSDTPGALAGFWEMDGRTPNHADGIVNGRCDLLDFFPVQLFVSDVQAVLPPSANVEYRLSQEDGAVNFVYTSSPIGSAGSFLITDWTSNFGSTFNKPAWAADTIRVTADGVVLSPDFLARGSVAPRGVILLEGVRPTTKPLKLTIRRNGAEICSRTLPLSISPVENMYRWLNLRGAIPGAPVDRPTQAGPPPNLPDSACNGKQFVFVHGYNTDEHAARGWISEFFKRLYRSGSRAMYTGVTWFGDASQFWDWIPGVGGTTPNYYLNVEYAFQTASAFATEIQNLPGQKFVAAHSLANVLVSSAIQDHGMQASAYFMFNAAAPIEAYDPAQTAAEGVNMSSAMQNPFWTGYSDRLWASEWHRLFDDNDGRRQLTWRGRFGNIPNVVNYFSSGEDVLQNGDGQTHFWGMIGTGGQCAWANQEMLKGSSAMDMIPGNSEGGWGFSSHYDIEDGVGEDGRPIVRSPYPAETTNISESALMQHSFFKPFDNQELFTSTGSSVAANPALRSQLLADAIPALSFAAGANRTTYFGPENQDMTDKENRNYAPWPRTRNRWFHGDIVNLAYPYVIPLFDDIVRVKGGFQ